MRALESHHAALVLIAILVTVTTGCSSPKPTAVQEPVAAPPVSAAETETPDVAVSAGDIKKVASGSVLRDELFEAAATGLDASSDQFTVYQLFEQGTAAVGDLKPAGGSRVFVALVSGPDGWKLAWSAPFGSSQARAGALLAAAPGISSELAARIDWDKKAPVKTVKATPPPSLASFRAFALRSARELAGTTYEGSFSVQGKIAQDSTGRWWGNAIAEPSEEGLESIGIWGSYTGGTWTGEIADFSSEDADAAFFPPDVLKRLAF